MRTLRLIGVMVAGSLAALSAGPAHGATAAAAGACKAPDFPSVGYFSAVSAHGVGCPAARRIVLAHYRCHLRNGLKGRCHRRVLGYRCQERRVSIPTELDGRVSCRRGARRVSYLYQQDL